MSAETARQNLLRLMSALWVAGRDGEIFDGTEVWKAVEQFEREVRDETQLQQRTEDL